MISYDVIWYHEYCKACIAGQSRQDSGSPNWLDFFGDGWSPDDLSHPWLVVYTLWLWPFWLPVWKRIDVRNVYVLDLKCNDFDDYDDYDDDDDYYDDDDDYDDYDDYDDDYDD